MAKEAALTVELRSERGTAASRRMRWSGQVPGNIYGHKQDPQAVVVDRDLLAPLVMSGVRVFDVTVDGKVDKAILKEVQFDSFGLELTHFDLMRVDPNEMVTVHVPIELKGTAPGVLGGGILDQPIHTVTIHCKTYQIPDAIQVRIGALEIGQSIHVRDLDLPTGITLDLPGDAIVVHVVQVQTKELTAAEGGPAEPEVIGKKAADAAADDKAKDAKKK